jgi:hypothetical protein
MPMIDVYAAAGTFPDKHRLARDLANAVMRWEKVPPINHFKKNTAAFVHDLLAEAISNAVGDSHYVGVQVPTEGAIHVMRVRVADEALAELLAGPPSKVE